MEHFCIVTNKSKDADLGVTHYIRDYLLARGKTCDIAEDLKTPVDTTGARKFMSTIPENTDCVIVLGGDGTMLQAARSIAFMDIPLIGVNLGTVGYLAEVEKGSIDEALERILSGDFYTEERMMIKGSIGEKKDYALNDIVVTRSSTIQVINFNIYINDMLLACYHADGVIISTPTGSTGYNMSAGGPIVEPSANMILVTPICPHTLNSRSMVLSADTKISIEIGPWKDDSTQNVIASFDGSGVINLKTGDRIEIIKSKKTTKIIKLNRVSFIEVLGKKFDK
ncbi:NAD(+)/NADH kinase [Butyrivibrio sp. MC2021]|uniref:NAD(+)/NADH kinase n=1 Tax=Butyrivibrio sp. MC2021 TaxID=1408306 RepID=UPI000479BC35|nr:NAD(+)/NADH kinase [Butyrivibrio sp. MC2021]